MAGQNTQCPAIEYFLDFKLIQIQKTEFSRAIFVEITKILLKTVFNSATAQQLMH